MIIKVYVDLNYEETFYIKTNKIKLNNCSRYFILLELFKKHPEVLEEINQNLYDEEKIITLENFSEKDSNIILGDYLIEFSILKLKKTFIADFL
jgi:hypothetical protein